MNATVLGADVVVNCMHNVTYCLFMHVGVLVMSHVSSLVVRAICTVLKGNCTVNALNLGANMKYLCTNT